MLRMVYAGVGSRKAPKRAMDQAFILARQLADEGWILRTGGAIGMDAAWLAGATPARAEVYRAVDCTADAWKLASGLHPAWSSLSDHVKMLHGRNMMIVLGPRLDDPVAVVACWTPAGARIGGTAMALRVADYAGIPIRNLGLPSGGLTEKQLELL